MFFSEIPELFRTTLHPNVVLLHLSTPDEHGYCSFGVSCDYTKPAAECADLLIAQINPKMPRTMVTASSRSASWITCGAGD